jgi:NADH-quinone oxidoreductase subunit M
MGLPLMSGFAAEFILFQGSFASDVSLAVGNMQLFTALAMFGIVIVAGYLLWAMQRTLFGEYDLATDYDVGRAPTQDVLSVATLLGLVILLGVAPDIFFEMIRDASTSLVGGGA